MAYGRLADFGNVFPIRLRLAGPHSFSHRISSPAQWARSLSHSAVYNSDVVGCENLNSANLRGADLTDADLLGAALATATVDGLRRSDRTGRLTDCRAAR